MVRLKFCSVKVQSLFDFATTLEVAFLYGGQLVPSEVPTKNTGFHAVFVFVLIFNTKNGIMASEPSDHEDLYYSNIVGCNVFEFPFLSVHCRTFV